MNQISKSYSCNPQDEEIETPSSQNLIVQSCLIEQNTFDHLNDKSPFTKPVSGASFISSFVEESKRLSLKTLSDGGSFDDEDTTDDNNDELNRIQSELQEVVDKIDESIKGCNDIIVKDESEPNAQSELLVTSPEKTEQLEAETVGDSSVCRKLSEFGVTAAAEMMEHLSLGKRR